MLLCNQVILPGDVSVCILPYLDRTEEVGKIALYNNNVLLNIFT